MSSASAYSGWAAASWICCCSRLADVAEKLDYTPGVFTVERHIRGKWACAACQTPVQAPVPAQVIDKGIPTAGLLAQVLVSKYADHAPLYRQEQMFGRAGLAIARSTQGAWVGAAVYGCSPWWTRCARRCSRPAFCMPTRRRCRCSSPATARRIAPTSGVAARRRTTRSGPWSTTSPTAVPGATPGITSATGAARSCATTTRATRRCSKAA